MIYLDNHATTPMDPRVKAAMDPYFTEHFGNPASQSHGFGWKAQMAVDKARSQVADLFSLKPKNVVFTSGATESNNLGILGSIAFLKEHGDTPHIITTAIEHKGILQVVEKAKTAGCEITIAPVNQDGTISIEILAALIRPNTRLISVMAANNEIGTINSLREISELCSKHNVIFHTDAAQAVGRMPLSFEELKIDLLSVAGQKIYGPKGAGALLIRPINRLFQVRPIMAGGEQEWGLRPGTLNVPGIVALGAACEIMNKEMTDEVPRITALRNMILDSVASNSDIVVNGSLTHRLCGNISLSFRKRHPDEILDALNGVAFSSSSACSSGDPKPSYVLKSIGHSDELARSTVRFGIGRFNTRDEIVEVINKLKTLI